MAKQGMPKVKHQILLAAGVSFVGFSIILSFLWQTFFTGILYKYLSLSSNSETYEIWKNPPVPIYMNFYFYNWTNPEMLGIEKPKLEEKGPYRFNELDEKSDIVWNDNSTVTYKRKRTWHFDYENSNGSLDDLITTINPVALSAANSVKYWSGFMKRSLSIAITSTKQTLAVSHTVGEMLFDGYTDPLLDFAKKLPTFAGVNIPYDKFGWFYLRNESDIFEGIFNMDTGADDIYKFGKLHNWNYNNYTPFYDGECGRVKGTAGEVFPPEQTKTSRVEMFSADLCRSISLKYTEETERMGIKGYKFIGGPEMVDNGTLDASNECYCDGECVPSGVINVTSCRYGAPGFISYPHFYLADPYFTEQVDGMQPSEEKHDLYIVLEPNTGIPLDVAARFQINLLLSPVSAVSLFKNAPKIFFPMMWFEQRASISEDLAFLLKIVLSVPTIGQAIAMVFLFSGLLMIGIYAYILCVKQERKIENLEEELKMPEAPYHPLIKNGVKPKIKDVETELLSKNGIN